MSSNSRVALSFKKLAPASGTPLALKYLEAYLEGKPNRKKAVKALLGCSERTAGRIASRKKPYTAPMKMEWVTAICEIVGKPVGDILGTRMPKTWRQCLLGWNNAHNAVEALQFATDCGLSIVYRAMTHFRLTGSFSVEYAGGYPNEVVVSLSTAPELSVLGGEFKMHQIVITADKVYNGGKRLMMLQHINPNSTAAPDKNFLTPKLLEYTLANIYALTKNFTAGRQRESASSAA